jgi:UDP-glucose 4-epimerase
MMEGETVKVLVTGGAGFIGRHLVRALVRAGRGSIIVLDNLHRSQWTALEDVREQVGFIEGDIRDERVVRKACRGVSVVFHLAAQSSVMTAAADSAYTSSVNADGTRVVLEAAAAEGVGRVVFTSSREVYGDPREIPVPEIAVIAPKNVYGISKAKGEEHCLALAHRIDSSVVRLANVYGPGDRDRVLPLFLEAALANRPLTLYGGQQVIDFVWVQTVVEVLIRCGFGPAIAGPVNIGSGKGTTVAELAQRVIAETGSESTVQISPPREIEVSKFVADVARAKEIFGLTPPEDPLFQLETVVAALRKGKPPVPKSL